MRPEPEAAHQAKHLPTELDLRLFAEGRHQRLWEVLGSHVTELDGVAGTVFAVWAPHARQVAVVGPWNRWDAATHLLSRLDAGVWAGFVPGVGSRTAYKYALTDAAGQITHRADPMAQLAEHTGGMASVVFASEHQWADGAWMDARLHADPVADRISAYEVHLGSWRRHDDGRVLSYRELAPLLADYVIQLGFTHVELMPVAEHPFEPSWGYQVTGFYAPTSRFGDPDDFRWFVDHLHQRGIGVIVDWVPAHFPRDAGALVRFDGRPLYEHTDPQRAEHPDWGTLEFDHGRAEVRGFLIANALYWLGELHVDGLRVDAVASMLYRDYSRGEGQWTPNVHGGHQDLEAVAFLQELNTIVHGVQSGTLTIAEESTAWEGVSKPAHAGGLGFTHKWNMGWMHDTLGYWVTDPSERSAHHARLTFGLTYAWAEHFVLPLSHDEVVHLKKPLLGKMPGDDDTRFAHLRALFAWMWAHPGKQLLFMGGELAETREWSHDRSLDWELLRDERHAGVQRLVADLNGAQATHPALHLGDGDPQGFAWLAVDDSEHSIFAFERLEPDGDDVVVCVANLQDTARKGYRIGLRRGGPWRSLLSTDDERYAGSGRASGALQLDAEPVPWQGRSHSAVLTLPPITVLYLAT
jgi:1,4-alpha-glucan branching enzyme